jgi:shikimate kinase
MVNPRQKWAELMNARRPIYESLADLKIDVSEKTVDEIASQIVETL